MVDILIVDDHPIVAEGMKTLILQQQISSKCFVAHSFDECKRILQVFTPGMVLLDYCLPDGNGAEICKLLKQNNNSIKILAISSYRERSIIKLMLDSGASGFVLKNASGDEIAEAIKAVLEGKRYICDDSYEIMEKNSQAILTRRETEILQYIADGFTNAEIAEKLFIGQSTVDSHRRNMLIKLNAKNTACLIKMALQQGIIS